MPCQPDPSAQAPCTRTTEGWDPSWGFVLIASSFRTRFFPVAGQPFHWMDGATIRTLARTSENSFKANFRESPKGEVHAGVKVCIAPPRRHKPLPELGSLLPPTSQNSLSTHSAE